MSLVHIAGNVTRYGKALDKKELFGHTELFFVKYGQFTQRLDRGDLEVTTDQACQWTFFLFHTVPSCKH